MTSPSERARSLEIQNRWEEEVEQREAGGSDWEPGDNLYHHPHGAHEQYVRELFQTIDADEITVDHFLNGILWEYLVRCVTCVVGWHPSQGKTCWNCGEDVTHHTFKRAVAKAAERDGREKAQWERIAEIEAANEAAQQRLRAVVTTNRQYRPPSAV